MTNTHETAVEAAARKYYEWFPLLDKDTKQPIPWVELSDTAQDTRLYAMASATAAYEAARLRPIAIAPKDGSLFVATRMCSSASGSAGSTSVPETTRQTISLTGGTTPIGTTSPPHHRRGER